MKSNGKSACLILPPAYFSQRLISQGVKGKGNTLPVKQQVGFEPGHLIYSRLLQLSSHVNACFVKVHILSTVLLFAGLFCFFFCETKY